MEKIRFGLSGKDFGKRFRVEMKIEFNSSSENLGKGNESALERIRAVKRSVSISLDLGLAGFVTGISAILFENVGVKAPAEIVEEGSWVRAVGLFPGFGHGLDSRPEFYHFLGKELGFLAFQAFEDDLELSRSDEIFIDQGLKCACSSDKGFLVH